jgi:hypothetical protein
MTYKFNIHEVLGVEDFYDRTGKLGDGNKGQDVFVLLYSPWFIELTSQCEVSIIKEAAGWKDVTEDLHFQFIGKASPSCQVCC